MSNQSYQDLDVWQRAMTLAEKAYAITSSFPKSEMFGLTNQIRRAASSVPANIAEGWARHSDNEFVYFLRIAHGSLREVESHLILSSRIKFCDPDSITPILEEITIISKQLLSLMRHIKGKSNA
ncbi:MAG: four helix bundle protein [Candidatus Cloacimonetes bacterium]|nr:four helix bundle protein [Candidatus Cloacimonadota bacterium]